MTAGEFDISLRTELQSGVNAVYVLVSLCVVEGVGGWVGGWEGRDSHTQPVEGPLAPDISTGLAAHSYCRNHSLNIAVLYRG